MKRRKFIQTAAAAGTVAIIGSGRAFAGEKLPNSNRGIIFKAVKGGNSLSEDAARQLQTLGFDGVEPSAPGIADIAAYRATADAAGLRVHGVVDRAHWKQRLSSPDPAVREAGITALGEALRDARILGGSSVLLVPGKVTGDDETHDHVWERSTSGIREVLPIASKLGVRILIETVWNGFCESPEQMRDYLDEINSPWVGCYFDIGNMQKFAPAEKWILTLGSRIVKLDVKDWGEKNGFCKLGEGDVNWPEVRKALASVGFAGWATREGSDGSLAETARLMNELLDL